MIAAMFRLDNVDSALRSFVISFERDASAYCITSAQNARKMEIDGEKKRSGEKGWEGGKEGELQHRRRAGQPAEFHKYFLYERHQTDL